MSWGVATQNGVSVSIASIVSLSSGATEFSPYDLFTGGAKGAWYDPSDYSTLFQDSAGTTPVTAVEQPVGLMLDKSQGLALGSELVTGSASAYSGNGTVATVGDTVTATCTTNGIYGITWLSTFVSNLWVLLTVEVVTNSASKSLLIFPNGNSTALAGGTTTGSKSFIALAPTATGSTRCPIFYINGLVGESFSVRLVSIKSYAGNHASQSTAASRPVLRARYNLLTYSEQFDNAVWARTGLDAFGSGSVANATTAPDGTTTADFIRPGTTLSGQRLIQNPVPSQTAQTLSIYVKASGYSKVALKESQTTGNYASFDLSNGTVLANTAGVGTSITALPNSWYRISMTLASATSCGLQVSVLAPVYTTGDPNGSTFSGDGTSGVFVWGAMLNPGSSAGTYQRIAAATDYATAGFLPYLDFITDDSFSTGSIDFTATDKMFVCAGITKNSDSGTATVLEAGTNAYSSAGFNLFAPRDATAATYGFSLYQTALASYSAATFAAPITSVVSCAYDYAGATIADEIKPRINGVIPSLTIQNAGPAGTGNFGNYSLYIGRRNNASLPLNGRIYQMIVCGKTLSASELASTEAFVATKTGVTL